MTEREQESLGEPRGEEDGCWHAHNSRTAAVVRVAPPERDDAGPLTGKGEKILQPVTMTRREEDPVYTVGGYYRNYVY